MSPLSLSATALGLVLFVAFIVANLAPATSAIHAIRTAPQTDALECTTGAGDTTCQITLTTHHIFATTQGLTVNETSPGTGPQSIEIGGNRLTVVVSALATSTAFEFNATYQKANPALAGFEGFDAMLERMPILLLLVSLISIAIFGGVWALGSDSA